MDSIKDLNEFGLTVLGVMHILKLNGISEVNVGGLLRILGMPSAAAEVYDEQFIMLVSDDEIAPTTVPPNTVIH